MALDALPELIRNHYEVHEWKHASAILERDFPVEWQDVIDVLTEFRHHAGRSVELGVPPMAGVTAESTRALAELVAAAMERHRVPGVAVGIWHAGEEYVAGFGVTSVEHPLPVDADTIFQIASISKTFTATAMMRLVERGLVDLDAPVRRYLPGFALGDDAAAARLTVRQLFQHVAGFEGDYFDDFGRGDDALARYIASLPSIKQVTPVGERWSYNNAAFNVAGRVMEVAAGQSFETLVRELVLDPLGLGHTCLFPEEVLTHRFAAGHTVIDGQVIVVRPWGFARNCAPAFGLASTVRDLLQYARFHMGDGTVPGGQHLLKPETLRLMQAPAVPAGQPGQWTGIAWLIETIEGVKVFGHGGSSNGQRALLRLAPERGFALAVLTNGHFGDFVTGEILRWALQHFLGIRQAEPEHVPVEAERLPEYTGLYRKRLSEFRIEVEAGALVLHPLKVGGVAPTTTPKAIPEPARLAFIGPDRVISVGPGQKGQRGQFVRGPDGQVVWLHWGGRLNERIEP